MPEHDGVAGREGAGLGALPREVCGRGLGGASVTWILVKDSALAFLLGVLRHSTGAGLFRGLVVYSQ